MPRSARTAAATALTHGWSGGSRRARTGRRSTRPRRAATRRRRARPRRRARAAGEVGAERHAEAALDGHAVGHRARPLAALDAPDADRVGQRERAHRRVLDVAVERSLVRLDGEVDADVAVERRAAREPHARRARRGRGTVRAEGQRAGLRADDLEAGRLGDQARVEGGVALERGERAEPAVLLRGDRQQHDLRALARRAARPARAAPRRPRPSCRPRRGRGRSRPRSRPTTGRGATARCPRPTTSTWPQTAIRPGRVPGQRHRQAAQLVARRLLARVVRVGAQRGEVVLVQLGLEAERVGQLAEPLERRRARRR